MSHEEKGAGKVMIQDQAKELQRRIKKLEKCMSCLTVLVIVAAMFSASMFTCYLMLRGVE